mmetsp:Transcript_6422/g.18347  ORF Transcript_6422/g.18347 Transcript_6422/m.18347 type:complete len:166 (-) Transcript_6422:880-1377(-)
MAAFTIDHGESKSMGPDLLVSFHDNDHYNSVRKKLHPPKPSRIKVTPANGQASTIIQINNNTTNNECVEQESPEIECVTASLSGLPLSDEAEQTTDTGPTKTVKRSAPCPCGSGLRYKKCCLAKQKQAIRVERLRAKQQHEDGALSTDTEEEETKSPEMFRVVAI